jgi:hypothetical protein
VKYVVFIAALVAITLGLGAVLAGIGGLDGGRTEPPPPDERPPDALLSERLAIAYAALRDAAGTRRLAEVHRYTQVAVDAIAGPAGRHGRRLAPPTGVLPEDREQISAEPGLALRAHDAAPEESPLRATVAQQVVGDAAGWRFPRARYDAIDRAVADYGPRDDAIAALSGAVEQALAWALLALRADDVNDAHDRADRGARAARRALDAVRIARAAAE